MTKASSIKKLFEGHPERWTKGTMALGAKQDRVIPSRKTEVSREIVAWCLYGAAVKMVDDRAAKRLVDPEALPLSTFQVVNLLRDSIKRLFPQRSSGGSVIEFNDHNDTTFEDVMAVVRDAEV